MPYRPIWDLLKGDHEDLVQLVVRLRSADEAGARELLSQLTREFTAHARAEETVLYGHLLHDACARPTVLDALAEHKRLEAAVAELERMRPDEERWIVRVACLEDSLRHHFQVEDAELFTRARQILTELQSSELGERFAAERARVMRDLSGLDEPV